MKTTKVVCPSCGAEIAIPKYETPVVGVAIGQNSGLGTITLPLANDSSTQTKKRMTAQNKLQAMKAAGIDVTNMFAVLNAEGAESLACVRDGKIQLLDDNDPMLKELESRGTVYNPNLFRRWVMAQVFHMLTRKHWATGKTLGFLEVLQSKGYCYSWEMLIEELRVQERLSRQDKDNFIQRNRWFNQSVALEMARDYVRQLTAHIKLKLACPKYCKQVPYITLRGTHVFVSDLKQKVQTPFAEALEKIQYAYTPYTLWVAVMQFYKLVKKYDHAYNMPMSIAFKNAYKGAGGYYTMRNLILFHNCYIYDDCGKRLNKKASLERLTAMAEAYKDGEGWRMFGAMKELIKDNHIDIEAKMAEWRKHK